MDQIVPSNALEGSSEDSLVNMDDEKIQIFDLKIKDEIFEDEYIIENKTQSEILSDHEDMIKLEPLSKVNENFDDKEENLSDFPNKNDEELCEIVEEKVTAFSFPTLLVDFMDYYKNTPKIRVVNTKPNTKLSKLHPTKVCKKIGYAAKISASKPKRFFYPTKSYYWEREALKTLIETNFRYEILHVKPMIDSLGSLRGQTSFAVVGDEKGHLGYSLKYHCNRITSMEEAVIRALNDVFLVDLTTYIFAQQKRNTISRMCTGQVGRMTITLFPSESGNGINTPYEIIKDILRMATIDDVRMVIRNPSDFVGDFGKAICDALREIQIKEITK